MRLDAFGPDANNLIAFMQQAESKSAYAVIPQYDIKGSITQLDENLIRKQSDAGVGFNPFINIGVAKDAARKSTASGVSTASPCESVHCSSSQTI